MSKLSPLRPSPILTFLNSPGTHAQLSKMPKMYGISPSQRITLTCWFSAFIKEMGVSVDGLIRQIPIQSTSMLTFEIVQQDDLSKLSYGVVLHLSEDH